MNWYRSVIALGLLLLALASHAQEFPSRPLRMVIAFPPGGPADIVGRHVAERMASLLHQPIIVDNRPGANGAVGAEFVAKSAPDGYTLFLTTVGAVAVTPHLRKDTPYDPVRDFTPVSLVVNNTLLFVVNAGVPAKSAVALRVPPCLLQGIRARASLHRRAGQARRGAAPLLEPRGRAAGSRSHRHARARRVRRCHRRGDADQIQAGIKPI